MIYSAASTFTRWLTLRIIPGMAAVSLSTTDLCIRVSPRPLIVSFCSSGRLIPERTSVTLSLSAIVVPLRSQPLEGLAASAQRLFGAAQLLQRIHGRVNHVV